MTSGAAIRQTQTRDLRPMLGVALTGAIALAAIAAVVGLALDPAAHAAVERALLSPVGLLVLFLISAVTNATLILPVPGLALTAVAATIADPLTVALVAGTGQAVGETTGYLAGASGRALLPSGPRMERMTRWMGRRGAVTLFVLAAIPNPVFDVAGILAGALRMPFLVFLTATGLGKVVKNLLLALIAANGVGILTGAGG